MKHLKKRPIRKDYQSMAKKIKTKRKKRRRALTPAEKRAKLALHHAIHTPRMAFRKAGTQMPSDIVVHKKNLASEAQNDSTD